MKFLLIAVVSCLLTARAIAADVIVGAIKFEDKAEIQSEQLTRLGAGVRKKFFLPIYALGVYTKSGSCELEKIIEKDESKYMKLVIMLPEVPGKMISDALKESIEKNLPDNPSPELLSSIDSFLGIFNFPLKKDAVVEFNYLKDLGFFVTVNGEKKGEVSKSYDLARLVWNNYFAEDSCCSGLRKTILEMCPE